MKILLISPEDIKGKNWGGVSTYTVLLAEYLAKLNHKVYILTPGTKDDSFFKNGYTVFRIRNRRETKRNIFLRIINKILVRLVPNFIERLFWCLDVFYFFKKKGPFDIVEAPEWGSSTLFISLFSKQKVVVTLHRSWYLYKTDNQLPLSLSDWLISMLELICIFFAEGINSPTKFMLVHDRLILNIFKRLKGEKHLAMIPYGIPMMKVSKKRKTGDYILFVGRVEKAKGVFILVKAFTYLSRQFPHLKLYFVGEDRRIKIGKHFRSYKKWIRAFSKKNKLEKRILFFPRKTREELKRYYNQCLFCVIPSRGKENLPFVLLEAMSFNKALIGANTGGIPEAIRHGKNGLLFKPEDWKDLAGKLTSLLKDSKLRLSFEKKNSDLKHDYDINKIILKKQAFYQKLKEN